MILPKSITVHQTDNQVEIIWTDGHQSMYPFQGLRRACPCAYCKGGHEFMNQPPDMKIFFEPKNRRIIHIKRIQPTGNYALQFFWSDGHDAGIYKWEYLRSICPCKECQPQFYK